MNDDTFTIDISKPTDNYPTTITTSTPYISSPSDSTVTINLDHYEMNDTGTEFVYNTPQYDPQPFVDIMPDLDHVEAMCNEYPALEKVYEQFKLIYKMTEQDYKGKLKERGK